MTGFPPVTLMPAGSGVVFLTLQDLGLPGAPLTEMPTERAVPTVPETVNVALAAPLVGVAGVTLNTVAPATEL